MDYSRRKPEQGPIKGSGMKRAKPKRRATNRIMPDDASEHSIQSKLVGKILPPLLKRDIVPLAIPNGGLRHPVVGKMLRAEGLLPGSPDLVFPLQAGATAWLEMKKLHGRLRDEQLGMKARLQRLGHQWAVADSIEEALEFLYSVGALR
jgi:hypothetical protein